MSILIPVKTKVVDLNALPVQVPVMVFPEILDVVVPGLQIRAARNPDIELLECSLAYFGEHVVDRQFEKPQLFWGKVISIASSLKNLDGLFAVGYSNLPVSIRGIDAAP